MSSISHKSIREDEYDVTKSQFKKLLGVKFDTKLTFENHITDICSKVCWKIYALARVAPSMNLSKRRIPMNTFFNSRFNYCPMIWICHNCTINRKINRLHERC